MRFGFRLAGTVLVLQQSCWCCYLGMYSISFQCSERDRIRIRVRLTLTVRVTIDACCRLAYNKGAIKTTRLGCSLSTDVTFLLASCSTDVMLFCCLNTEGMHRMYWT
jgi:hypothetical protein